LHLKQLNSSVLLLLQLSLLLLLTDVCLEVFKLLLGGSFTFIIVHCRFWKRFNRCVSDWNEHLFLLFSFLLFLCNFLSFGLYLLFESDKISFIFNDDLILNSVSVILFVTSSIFSGKEEGSSYKSFGGNLWSYDFVILLRHVLKCI